MIVLRPLHPFLRPLYQWWARRPRYVRADGLDLTVLPGVFHPSLFHSTGTLARHVASLPIAGRSFLELGAGAGRVALVAARKGAQVTASDINPAAILNIALNAQRNALSVRTVQSDLFDALPGHFDLIAINPPYYAIDPRDHPTSAFYAGEDHNYFNRLFPLLAKRIGAGTDVRMVLSSDPRLDPISALAGSYGIRLVEAYAETHWGERQVVYHLQ